MNATPSEKTFYVLLKVIMSDLGFELLLRFLWGTVLLLSFVSRTETTERFVRIIAWIELGLSLFAAWLASTASFAPLSSLGALALLTMGVFLYAFSTARLLRIVGFLAYTLAPLLFLWTRSTGAALNFCASGLLMGAIFAGQYLGHWFLNVPGLHIRELQRLVKIFFVSLVFRTLVVVWTLFVSVGIRGHFSVDAMGRPIGTDISQLSGMAELNPAQSLLGLPGDSWFGLGFFGLILLITRLLWGILAPWILGFMIRSTVNSRSTQSATGIYYALSVMILLGEGTALYIQNTLGWLI